MKENLVSVIIPIYNVEKYLDRCIESIINQTYKTLEIILIDDGSIDLSGKKCDKWAKKDKRIKVIHQENCGVSSARNKGIDNSKGKYIVFIDSDDYVNKNFIKILKNNIDKNNSDMSICSFFYVTNKNKKQSSTNSKLNIMDKKTFLDNMTKDYYKGYLWNKMFLREKINTIRFDIKKSICEDLLFVVNYILNCNKICYTPEPLYYYVQHENSVMHKLSYEQIFEQVMAFDEIIDTIKKDNTSDIYYHYGNMSISIAMNLRYNLKRTNKENNKKKIEDIDKIVKKYLKYGCAKREKNLLKRTKIYLCVYLKNIFQILKKCKIRRS